MRIRSNWVLKLFLTAFSVLLLAGTISLVAPGDVLAAGGDITISGPGLNSAEPVTFTQNQLRGKESVLDGVYFEQQDVIYSTINTWPTKSWYRGEGVLLTDLLEAAGGIKPEATQIRFISSDGFKAIFTLEELLYAPRYYFPNFMDTGLPGHLPGDASGAFEVPVIIAHRSFSAQDYEDILDPENFSRSDANHLLYGQRAVTQQTNARFSKYVTGIEVLTEPASKWDNPTATPGSGVVPAGTMVELHSPYDDEDKVHYTLDGSDPTIESPMYNWIASRWWSSRADELNTINRPIEITRDTTIKAKVIGPGRLDSDIVTFEYKIGAVPPALTADTSDNTVGQSVDITFTDDAAWRAAITGITVNGSALTDEQYEVTEGNINITADVFTEAGDYEIVVSATGYCDATVTQTMLAVAKTWYVDDSGDADFTSIQAAVTAASAGDTIIVKDGTYSENIIVDKSLVIQSENGSAQTIIQAADSKADVIDIAAANVTIDGFTVSGATATGKSGIKISGSSSGSCTIRNNISTGNNQGISIEANAANNTVSNNVVTQSGRYGIYLFKTTGNFITGNTCSNNTDGSGYAIYLADDADNNTVSGNVSDSNIFGIRVKAADSNNIFNNIFSSNNYGLEIATKAVGNVFYQNNFIDNIEGQLSAGFNAIAGNFWNSQEDHTYMYNDVQYTGPVGNYWSDYTGADADGNGIGDTPYQTIATDKDDYPLMGLWQDGTIATPEAVALTITGDGVPADVKLTLSQVLALPQVTHNYSAINNWPTKDLGFVGVKGVRIQDLLDQAQIKDEAKLITFKASDGMTQTFTIDELLVQPRYYFPGLMEDSSDGKELVPAILSTDTLDKNGLRLIMGQRAVTEQNKPWFVKKVNQITVSTEEPEKWDNVTADVPEGVVEPGTKVTLGHTSIDGVKIYYTLDGSTPDVNSNMYNKSATYYQPELNVPIEITTDTVIKAIAIGPGRADSDVVTFTYTVAKELLPAPVLTADTSDNTVGQPVEITFTDDEAWRSAITEITVDGAALANDKYTVSAGIITINADVFTEAKDYTVVVKAAGYEDAAVVQTIKEASGPHPVYTVTPEADDAYTTGTTPEGISTMTVNSGVTGFKYFTVNIAPVISHSGNETVVFAHFRNGSQLAINATRADFDQVETAQAGFNVQSGDVIKAYIVDNLTNAIDVNPIIFQ